jgi:hypothetical protein
MSGDCSCGEIGRMRWSCVMDAGRGEVEVTLTHASPLRGVVRCGDQEVRPFEGWVSLACAVEACVAEEARRAADGRFSESASQR